jgi:hypothetical protein
MTDRDWAASLDMLQTRSDVRAFIATALEDLTTPGRAYGHLPAEIAGLSTASDREVLESYQFIRAFCERRSDTGRRLSGAAIGSRVRDLFGVALDRMKKLPPEPLNVAPIVPVAQVRRG